MPTGNHVTQPTGGGACDAGSKPLALGGPEMDAACKAFLGDPACGISIVTGDGQIEFCNEQSAKIYLGPDAVPAQVMGKPMASNFPEEWVRERISILGSLKESGASTMIRTIWRGRQLIAWVTRLSPSSITGASPRYLVTTRVVPTQNLDQVLQSQSASLIESRVARLGPLDVLTERELEVLALTGQGLSAKETGQFLGLAEKTIENHRAAISRKLKAHGVRSLVEYAQRAGLSLGDASRRRV